MSQEFEPTPLPPWKPPYGDWFVEMWTTSETAKVTLIPDPDGRPITVFSATEQMLHGLQSPDEAGRLSDRPDANQVFARMIATARVDGNCQINPDGAITFTAEPQVCNLITYPLHEPTPVPTQTATSIPSHPETTTLPPNPELDTFYALCTSGVLGSAAILAALSYFIGRFRQPRLVPTHPEPVPPSPSPIKKYGPPMKITDAAIDPATGIQVHYRGKFTDQQPPPQEVVAAARRFRNIFDDRTGIHGAVDGVTVTQNDTLGITMTGVSMSTNAPDFDAAIASARNAPLSLKIFHQLGKTAFKVLAFDYFHPKNNLE